MSVLAPSRQLLPRAALLVAAFLLAACAGGQLPPGQIADTTAPVTSTPRIAPDKVTVAFEPFTGAPGNISDSLSRRIGSQAVAQNLTLVRRVGAPATYRINGYLAASGDQSSTTMFYVFDVVDANGRRVHRILGQEDAPGASGDPWAGVDDDTLERAAKRAVAELNAWIRR